MDATEQSVQFHNLEPNSTEWKQVQFILATSILDQSFAVKNNWILESIQLVQNNKLLSEYRDKRQEMRAQGIDNQSMEQQYGFAIARDVNGLNRVLNNGLTAGQSHSHILGHSGKGVCVCRHVDVQLRVAQEVRQPKATMTTGRTLEVAISMSNIDPTPGYHSHVCVVKPQNCDDIKSQIIKSMTYLYELDFAGRPVSRPRHCCPFAVCTFSFKATSAVTPRRCQLDGIGSLTNLSANKQRITQPLVPSVYPIQSLPPQPARQSPILRRSLQSAPISSPNQAAALYGQSPQTLQPIQQLANLCRPAAGATASWRSQSSNIGEFGQEVIPQRQPSQRMRMPIIPSTQTTVKIEPPDKEKKRVIVIEPIAIDDDDEIGENHPTAAAVSKQYQVEGSSSSNAGLVHSISSRTTSSRLDVDDVEHVPQIVNIRGNYKESEHVRDLAERVYEFEEPGNDSDTDAYSDENSIEEKKDPSNNLTGVFEMSNGASLQVTLPTSKNTMPTPLSATEPNDLAGIFEMSNETEVEPLLPETRKNDYSAIPENAAAESEATEDNARKPVERSEMPKLRYCKPSIFLSKCGKIELFMNDAFEVLREHLPPRQLLPKVKVKVEPVEDDYFTQQMKHLNGVANQTRLSDDDDYTPMTLEYADTYTSGQRSLPKTAVTVLKTKASKKKTKQRKKQQPLVSRRKPRTVAEVRQRMTEDTRAAVKAHKPSKPQVAKKSTTKLAEKPLTYRMPPNFELKELRVLIEIPQIPESYDDDGDDVVKNTDNDRPLMPIDIFLSSADAAVRCKKRSSRRSVKSSRMTSARRRHDEHHRDIETTRRRLVERREAESEIPPEVAAVLAQLEAEGETIPGRRRGRSRGAFVVSEDAVSSEKAFETIVQKTKQIINAKSMGEQTQAPPNTIIQQPVDDVNTVQSAADPLMPQTNNNDAIQIASEDEAANNISLSAEEFAAIDQALGDLPLVEDIELAGIEDDFSGFDDLPDVTIASPISNDMDVALPDNHDNAVSAELEALDKAVSDAKPSGYDSDESFGVPPVDDLLTSLDKSIEADSEKQDNKTENCTDDADVSGIGQKRKPKGKARRARNRGWTKKSRRKVPAAQHANDSNVELSELGSSALEAAEAAEICDGEESNVTEEKDEFDLDVVVCSRKEKEIAAHDAVDLTDKVTRVEETSEHHTDEEFDLDEVSVTHGDEFDLDDMSLKNVRKKDVPRGRRGRAFTRSRRSAQLLAENDVTDLDCSKRRSSRRLSKAASEVEVDFTTDAVDSDKGKDDVIDVDKSEAAKSKPSEDESSDNQTDAVRVFVPSEARRKVLDVWDMRKGVSKSNLQQTPEERRAYFRALRERPGANDVNRQDRERRELELLQRRRREKEEAKAKEDEARRERQQQEKLLEEQKKTLERETLARELHEQLAEKKRLVEELAALEQMQDEDESEKNSVVEETLSPPKSPDSQPDCFEDPPESPVRVRHDSTDSEGPLVITETLETLDCEAAHSTKRTASDNTKIKDGELNKSDAGDTHGDKANRVVAEKNAKKSHNETKSLTETVPVVYGDAMYDSLVKTQGQSIITTTLRRSVARSHKPLKEIANGGTPAPKRSSNNSRTLSLEDYWKYRQKPSIQCEPKPTDHPTVAVAPAQPAPPASRPQFEHRRRDKSFFAPAAPDVVEIEDEGDVTSTAASWSQPNFTREASTAASGMTSSDPITVEDAPMSPNASYSPSQDISSEDSLSPLNNRGMLFAPPKFAMGLPLPPIIAVSDDEDDITPESIDGDLDDEDVDLVDSEPRCEIPLESSELVTDPRSRRRETRQITLQRLYFGVFDAYRPLAQRNEPSEETVEVVDIDSDEGALVDEGYFGNEVRLSDNNVPSIPLERDVSTEMTTQEDVQKELEVMQSAGPLLELDEEDMVARPRAWQEAEILPKNIKQRRKKTGYDNPEPRNVVGDKCAMSGWVTALSNKRRSSENRDEIPAKKQATVRPLVTENNAWVKNRPLPPKRPEHPLLNSPFEMPLHSANRPRSPSRPVPAPAPVAKLPPATAKPGDSAASPVRNSVLGSASADVKLKIARQKANTFMAKFKSLGLSHAEEVKCHETTHRDRVRDLLVDHPGVAKNPFDTDLLKKLEGVVSDVRSCIRQREQQVAMLSSDVKRGVATPTQQFDHQTLVDELNLLRLDEEMASYDLKVKSDSWRCDLHRKLPNDLLLEEEYDVIHSVENVFLVCGTVISETSYKELLGLKLDLELQQRKFQDTPVSEGARRRGLHITMGWLHITRKKTLTAVCAKDEVTERPTELRELDIKLSSYRMMKSLLEPGSDRFDERVEFIDKKMDALSFHREQLVLLQATPVKPMAQVKPNVHKASRCNVGVTEAHRQSTQVTEAISNRPSLPQHPPLQTTANAAVVLPNQDARRGIQHVPSPSSPTSHRSKQGSQGSQDAVGNHRDNRRSEAQTNYLSDSTRLERRGEPSHVSMSSDRPIDDDYRSRTNYVEQSRNVRRERSCDRYDDRQRQPSRHHQSHLKQGDERGCDSEQYPFHDGHPRGPSHGDTRRYRSHSRPVQDSRWDKRNRRGDNTRPTITQSAMEGTSAWAPEGNAEEVSLGQHGRDDGISSRQERGILGDAPPHYQFGNRTDQWESSIRVKKEPDVYDEDNYNDQESYRPERHYGSAETAEQYYYRDHGREAARGRGRRGRAMDNTVTMLSQIATSLTLHTLNQMTFDQMHRMESPRYHYPGNRGYGRGPPMPPRPPPRGGPRGPSFHSARGYPPPWRR